MAKNDTTTAAQQSRQPQSQNDQQSRSPQGQGSSQGGQMTRGGQQSGALALHGLGPLAFPLFAGELFRMNPFTLMRRMTEEIDRAVWAPTIEVREHDGNYVVRADLPGLKPEDVKVEVTDAGLVIEGERKSEAREDQGGVHRSEIQYGYFARVIPLPDGANVDRANAKFDNGVLEITIPVAQQQNTKRQIPVQGSSTNTGDGSATNTGSATNAGSATTKGEGSAKSA
jgi:HSP20 family protein